MPYEEVHVPAAILVDLEDNIVYYTYKYGDVNNPNSNWYTFEADSSDEFDVRNLPQYSAEKEQEATSKVGSSMEKYDERQAAMRKYHAQVVEQAYKAGELDEYHA